MKKYLFAALGLWSALNISAQEVDLLNMVDSAGKPEKEIVTATFKSTRNVNFHTTEILPKRSLDFRISHRFAPVGGKAYNAWGIDGPATLMLSLEYSYDGRWMAGVQRSFVDKMGDLFFKWKIVRQTKNGGSPVSITYFGGAYNTFEKDPNLGKPDKFYDMNWDRVSFVNQLMIARKWNSSISTQLGFAHVHYNLVGDKNLLGKNDVMVATGILRAKFTKRQAIIFEYGYRLNTDYGYVDPVTKQPYKFYDSMGIGWEIETGGHVFQVFVTNSAGLLENQFLIKSDADYSTSGMRIGFNITRIFAVGGKKGSW
jgi:hypothetical protein